MSELFESASLILQIIGKIQVKIFGISIDTFISINAKVIERTSHQENISLLVRSYKNGKYGGLLFNASFPQTKLPGDIGTVGSRLKIEGVVSSKSKDLKSGERIYKLEQCQWMF